MSIRSHFSNSTYAVMPYAYGILGLGTLLSQNPLAVLPGLVLLGAALYMGFARVRYRRAFHASNGFITLPTWSKGQNAVQAGGIQIPWRRSYECGHPIIDAQHRRLFGMCNDLSAMVAEGSPKGEVLRYGRKMYQHLEQHFVTEEDARLNAHRPLSGVHRDNHQRLLAQAADLLERLQVGAPVERELINFFAYTVIKDHVARESNMFTASLRVPAAPKPAGAPQVVHPSLPGDELLPMGPDDIAYSPGEFTEPAPLSERGFFTAEDEAWPKTVFMPGSGTSGESFGHADKDRTYIWKD